MSANEMVVQFLGKPLKIASSVDGDITHDETGWKEARLTSLPKVPRATRSRT